MTQYKICNGCQARVEASSNFCPHCKSQSFRAENEIEVTNGSASDFRHTLLYWRHGNSFVMSKSKLTAFAVFIIVVSLGIPSKYFAAFLIFGALIAFIVYVIGFGVHKIRSIAPPSRNVLTYNDYGLISDLKHLFLYWQNKDTGGFALSKTKTISLTLFLFFTILAVLVLNPPNLFAAILLGLIFGVPAFLIGFGCHKVKNPYPEGKIIPKNPKTKPKVERKVKKQIQEESKPREIKSSQYTAQIEELKSQFESKEKNVMDLIEKRFEPPQLTYTRFAGVVDKSRVLFDREYDTVANLINLNDDDSPRINSEIESKITILKSIIQKLDDLANELVLSMDSPDEGEVDDVLESMEGLIKSVKDYE